MKNYPWKSSAFCVFVPHHDEVAEFCEMIENTLAKDGIDTLFLIVRYDFEFQSHPECRGDFPITLEDAKVLQMISFLAPVLEAVSDEKQREELSQQLESAIRSL